MIANGGEGGGRLNPLVGDCGHKTRLRGSLSGKRWSIFPRGWANSGIAGHFPDGPHFFRVAEIGMVLGNIRVNATPSYVMTGFGGTGTMVWWVC